MMERNAQVNGNHVATITDKVTHTWIQVRHRIACVAKCLVDNDVCQDDKIAILGANSAIYLESLFIPAWIGAVAVPLNTRWSATENLYAIEDSGSSVLFFDDTFFETTEQIKSQSSVISTFVYMGEKNCPDWALSYNDMASSGEEVASITKGGNDMAFIMYTGGTTGHPKGVMLAHAGIYSSSSAVAMDCHCNKSDIYFTTFLFRYNFFRFI